MGSKRKKDSQKPAARGKDLKGDEYVPSLQL